MFKALPGLRAPEPADAAGADAVRPAGGSGRARAGADRLAADPDVRHDAPAGAAVPRAVRAARPDRDGVAARPARARPGSWRRSRRCSARSSRSCATPTRSCATSAVYKHEITGFFANVTAASQSHDVQLPQDAERGPLPAHLADADAGGAGVLQPALGINRDDAYRAPGLLLPARAADCRCSTRPSARNGNPAPPDHAIPSTLAPLVQQYAFRTTGRDVAAPRCVAQGPIPGFSTAFPQLRADPPPSLSATR